MEQYFLGTIKNGVFELDNKEDLLKHINKLAIKDKPTRVKIVIKRFYKIRSTGKITDKGNQNGYYWGCIIPILSEYFGYELDEMHEAIKYKFLRIGGTDDLPKIRSTASLNTIEWEDFMERIRIWALIEFNIIIPTVEDYYYPQNYE